MADTPIQSPNTRRDTPVAPKGRSRAFSEQVNNYKAMQTSFMEAYLTGSDVTEGFKKHKEDSDKDIKLQQLSQIKAQQEAQSITEGFIDNPLGDDGDIQNQAEMAASARHQAFEQANDTEMQFLSTLGTSLNFEEQDRQENLQMQASKQNLWKMFEEAAEETGFGEKARDFGMNILPFVASYRQARATGQMFGGKEVFEKAMLGFKQLPIEEQERQFPALKEELIDKLGPLQGIAALEGFLSPYGEESLGDFSDAWKIFDALDITGIGAILGSVVKSFRASRTLPAVAAAIGARETAEDITRRALIDPDMRAGAGLDDVATASNAMPFDVSLIDEAYTGGLSSGTIRGLDDFFGIADRTAEDIIQGKGFLREGILATSERANREAIALKQLREANHENIRVVDETANTTTFRYDHRDEMGNLIENEDFVLQLELSDAGTWQQDRSGTIRGFFGSQNVLARNVLREDVETAQRLDYLSARVNRELNKLQKGAIAPLGSMLRPQNRERLALVDDVLRKGDAFRNPDGSRGRVFTSDELRGVYGMDDGQIDSYYRINRVYNNLFHLRNAEQRSEMTVKGYRNINIGQGERTYGKELATPEQAFKTLSDNDAQIIYNADSGEMIRFNPGRKEDLDELYSEGVVVSRLDQPYETGFENGKVLYVATRAEDVTDLPATVLHRKEGYVPKVYPQGSYFIKEVVETTVDANKPFRNMVTHRFFDNRKEAETFREQLISTAMEENPRMTRNQAEARFPRALEDREAEIVSGAIGDISHGSGGLYTGARAQDDILFGLDGREAHRLSAFESLTRNIGNVSKQVSMNQWRMGLEQRWMNSVNEYLAGTGATTRVARFGTLPEAIQGTEAGEFFLKMQRQIKDWQGFPTREEQLFTGINQKMFDWASDRNFTLGKKVFGSMRGIDPVANARAAAFHSLLGWFNPVQLWVQAQGASVAMSLGVGKSLTQNLRDVAAFSTLGDRTATAAEYARHARVSGTSAEELAAKHKLWLETGFADSVLQTADHAAAARGHGIAMDSISKAADKGLLFYRHGEMFNRRLSFNVSLSRHMEATGKTVAEMGSRDLKRIMDESNNMLLNMSKANRAQWQKGVLGLPTQFLQVTSNYLETVAGFNRNFTGAERGRIFMGQMALYGAAGVPLAGLPIMYATEVLGLSPQDIENNPNKVRAINDGFWGVVGHWMLGEDFEMSSRGSLNRGITDFVDRIMYEDATMSEMFLGAFGTTGNRFFTSLTDNLRPIALGAQSVQPIDVARIPTMAILESIGTWRAQEKAFIMHQMGRIYTQSGDIMVDQDFDWRAVVGASIGFRLQDENIGWTLTERMNAADKARSKLADMAIKQMNDFALQAERGNMTEEDMEQHQNTMRLIMQLPENPSDRRDLQNTIRRRLRQPARRDDAVNQYIRKNLHERPVEHLSAIRSTLLGNSIIKLDMPMNQEIEEE